MQFTDSQEDVYEDNSDDWNYTAPSDDDGGANEWDDVDGSGGEWDSGDSPTVTEDSNTWSGDSGSGEETQSSGDSPGTDGWQTGDYVGDRDTITLADGTVVDVSGVQEYVSLEDNANPDKNQSSGDTTTESDTHEPLVSGTGDIISLPDTGGSGISKMVLVAIAGIALWVIS